MPEDCCSEVSPENSARTFSSPTRLVKRAENDNLIPRKASILEVGAGCLRNSKFLLSLGHQVAVIELPAILERYRGAYASFAKAGGTVLKQWPKSESYDMVVSTFTLETICRRTERHNHLDSIIRVVRRKGSLLLATRGPKDVKTAIHNGRKCGDGFITPSKTFIRPYTVTEITKLLDQRGSKITKIYGGSRENEPQIIEIVAEKQ